MSNSFERGEGNDADQISDILSICRFLDVSSHTIHTLAQKGIIKAEIKNDQAILLDKESLKILILELNRYERSEEDSLTKIKSWVTYEQAAEMLGITTEELNRLRQNGTLQGYFNKETVRFKSSDVRSACLKKWSNDVQTSISKVIKGS